MKQDTREGSKPAPRYQRLVLTTCRISRSNIFPSYDETIYNCFYEIEQLADVCIRKLVAADKFKNFLDQKTWLGDPEIPLRNFIEKIKVVDPVIQTVGMDAFACSDLWMIIWTFQITSHSMCQKRLKLTMK